MVLNSTETCLELHRQANYINTTQDETVRAACTGIFHDLVPEGGACIIANNAINRYVLLINIMITSPPF